MADVAAVYTITTPGGTVILNGGAIGDGTDFWYLTKPPAGLDGPQLRTPIDNAPQAHGGLVHNFWKGPRHPLFDGCLLIQSTRQGIACETIRNVRSEAFYAACDSILQQSVASGTLGWTPLGGTARSLTVQTEIHVTFDVAENFGLLTFSVGFVAADPVY